MDEADRTQSGRRNELRLVFVSEHYPPAFGTGVGTYVDAMTRALASLGHRITVVTAREYDLPARQSIKVGTHGIDVVRLETRKTGGSSRAARMDAVRAWSERACEYLHGLGEWDGDPIDAIEFGDRGEAHAYLSATRPGQRPTSVVRLHTSSAVIAKYDRGFDLFAPIAELEHQAMRLADRLVSPSRALAREITGLVPGIGRIDILPHPVDPALLEIDPAHERASRGLPSGEDGSEEILYVGWLQERKGVHVLVDAAREVLHACPRARLRLVGGDTPLGRGKGSMLANLQASLPSSIADRVHFEPGLPRAALIERYLAARVCVVPSLFENFPNTCLEAMALSRPTIGTDNSGMPEMMEHGVSGMITKAGDSAELAMAMIALYTAGEDERADMGRAARARVQEKFSARVIGREYAAWIASLRTATADGVPLDEFITGSGLPELITEETASAAGTVPEHSGMSETLGSEWRDIEQRAERELSELLASSSYRVVRRIKDLRAYRALADRLYGPGWENLLERGTARERLDRTKESRAYRLVMALRKATGQAI